jgi:hypothetical protein
MAAVSQALNVRLPKDLLRRVERVQAWLATQVPGATRTDAVRMVILRGLEAMEAGERRTAEDRSWMDPDLSRLGQFEPYDFGGRDPDRMGTAIQRLPDGTLLLESGP